MSSASRATRYRKKAPSREKAEWLSLVDAVIGLALSCASLEELDARIKEQSKALRNPSGHAVVLSTVHSAKGLEWDAVFLAGMEDGVLPHANADDIEEERRIAYVGVTRAKRLLGLTYAAERYGERSRPSPFLFELAGERRAASDLDRAETERRRRSASDTRGRRLRSPAA